MMLDAAAVDRSSFARVFDICVIGTGPAGITLARRLASHGFDVALMEGGDQYFTPESQGIYAGAANDSIGYDPLDVVRLRFFGGSSNHWGGRCRPISASDFAVRSHLPLSGWPIGKDALDPYAEEADSILDLPPPIPDRPIQQARDRFRQMDFRYSNPVTRFNLKYGDELAAAPRVTLVLNANLVDLRLDVTGRTVEAALFRTLDPGDPGFAVRARSYALCCGGIENPRLLLNFRSQVPAGIGNENDLVGRYFCEHPHFRIGEILYETPVPEAQAEAASCFLVPTEGYLAEKGSTNFALNIMPRLEDPLSLATEFARSLPCASGFTERLAEEILGRQLNCEGRGLGSYFTQGEGRQAWWADIRVTAEQTLQRDSRIALDESGDALGLRRARLAWRLGELDFASLRTAVLEFGAHCAEQGIGRVRLRDWLMADPVTVPGKAEGHRIGGHHHMCTTRMSDDPRTGVVDRDCRVHSVSNLFVGGSSVFATPGHANPTYTIVQLALRLGDHLAHLGTANSRAAPVNETSL